MTRVKHGNGQSPKKYEKLNRKATRALKKILKKHKPEAINLIDRVKDGTCSICGATPMQFRDDMFSGAEPAVREFEDFWECKKCGHTWPKGYEHAEKKKIRGHTN